MDSQLSEQIKVLGKKRKALEELIAFTQQLSRSVSSLSAVQQMQRHELHIKKDQLDLIERLQVHIANLSDTDIEERMAVLDQEIADRIAFIITIAQLDQGAFSRHYSAKSAPEAEQDFQKIQLKMAEFRRKAQTNVALRMELKKRGMNVDVAVVGIPQEDVLVLLEQIKKQEYHCKKKVIENLQSYLEDITLVLKSPDCPKAITQKLFDAKVCIMHTLEDLKNGKSVEEVDCCIEPIDLGKSFFGGPGLSSAECGLDWNEVSIEESATADAQASTKQSLAVDSLDDPEKAERLITSGSLGLGTRLKRWLLSPWSVSWTDTTKKK